MCRHTTYLIFFFLCIVVTGFWYVLLLGVLVFDVSARDWRKRQCNQHIAVCYVIRCTSSGIGR